MTKRSEDPTTRPFLYLVVCAAGIADGVDKLIGRALDDGWDVGVIATPTALNGFFDLPGVEERTGRPVRSAWRTPATPRPFPPADAVVVAPATFNTINKWAGGIADTLAVATLCEAYGAGVPVAAAPCVSEQLATHPAYGASLRRLRAMGVRFTEGAFSWGAATDLLTGLRADA
ncbi:flavoprotein [Streptomyces sp. VRA16 Mangrove soil]|uniref:flavoprotein n=1 Tax=Streptomyces sp. VRA16 Mangrove soil TaxID=2817434 RepID=UPI001A9F3BB2|nr:flavoprotein [Streptomyces sp. VRA16 Mangrove soil]MBO1334549.1 flavoprotein [Streptomyces sp. VRA16 Mangrove soil]